MGAGLTATWSAHCGAVLDKAVWPAISCLNIYSDQLLLRPIEVVGGAHKVPDTPGLGVELDLEAVERYRVHDGEVAAFTDRGQPYNTPRPRHVFTVRYPDGTTVINRSAGAGLDLVGQTPGVETEPWREDGSAEWNEVWSSLKDRPRRVRAQQ